MTKDQLSGLHETCMDVSNQVCQFLEYLDAKLNEDSVWYVYDDVTRALRSLRAYSRHDHTQQALLQYCEEDLKGLRIKFSGIHYMPMCPCAEGRSLKSVITNMIPVILSDQYDLRY